MTPFAGIIQHPNHFRTATLIYLKGGSVVQVRMHAPTMKEAVDLIIKAKIKSMDNLNEFQGELQEDLDAENAYEKDDQSSE